MGTTAEKLNYLKETKSEIKNALETPSNIFRDYPSLIKKFIDNQPTSKVSNGVCTNALDVPLVSLGVDGQSAQKSYEGYNIFNYKDVIVGKVISGETGEISNNGSYYFCGYIPVKPNTTYSRSENGTVGVCCLNENKEFIGRVDGTKFTTLDNTYYVGFNMTTAYYNNGSYKEFVMNEGDTLKAYEPYVGGQPSPIPKYPQDIEVIDGVNLYNESSYEKGKYITSDGSVGQLNLLQMSEKMKVSAGETYILSGLKDVVSYQANVSFWNNDTFLKREMFGGKSSSEYITKTTIIPNGCNYIIFSIYDNDSSEIQITKGTTPKPYLPHGCIGLEHTNEDGSKSEIIPINLNGNSIAKIGDVKDLLKVYRNGDVEIEKKRNRYVFTGDEDLVSDLIGSKFTDGVYGVSLAISNMKSYDKFAYELNGIKAVMCNYFSVQRMYGKVIEAIDNGWGKNVYIKVLTSRINNPTTLQEALTNFKQWFKNKYNAGIPVYVDYELATPETIKLPSISPIELWEGTNKFELITNLDTTFEMEYVVNKDYIMNTLETQNLLNAVEGENI